MQTSFERALAPPPKAMLSLSSSSRMIWTKSLAHRRDGGQFFGKSN